ncbi:transposase family protein [Burkholderia sp. R-70006]|uniref:transposase family protein n=1 Tax=Paraburkholderia domus TaxID=2793075 RepID=UPI001913B232|nr:transposase family protein [Paraburkholderia domus]MBK5047621.1 transposase family protein [Burkholderia sp. R-70006]MDR3739881.1 transposase family protein [Terracidiphilus sp.]
MRDSLGCGQLDRELWGQAKLEWLRRYIALEQGIPSHDTFGRVFVAFNPKQLETCFIRWMSALCPGAGRSGGGD